MTAGPEELWISTRGMVERGGCGCGRMSKVRSTCFGYSELIVRTPGQLAPLERIPPGGEMRDVPCSIATSGDTEGYRHEKHQNSGRLGENVSGMTAAALMPLPSGCP